jgi:hypothetical protein
LHANENKALTQRAILIYFYLLEKAWLSIDNDDDDDGDGIARGVWQGAYGKGRQFRHGVSKWVESDNFDKGRGCRFVLTPV